MGTRVLHPWWCFAAAICYWLELRRWLGGETLPCLLSIFCREEDDSITNGSDVAGWLAAT